MSARTQILKRLFSLTLLLTILAACGQGGTEIGNPNQPSGGSAPNSADGEGAPAAPSFEGPTPTPSPQSFLIENAPQGPSDPEEELAPSEPLAMERADAGNRWGMQEESEETPAEF